MDDSEEPRDTHVGSTGEGVGGGSLERSGNDASASVSADAVSEADERRASTQRELDALWAQATGREEEPSASESETQRRLHPFRVGDVLGITFSVLGKNPLLFLILATMASLPGIIFEAFFTEAELGRVSFLFIQKSVDIFLSMIFLGAIAYGVYQDLVGGRAGLWNSIAIGLRRYFSLAGISLAVLFLLIVTLFIAILCVSIFGMLGLLGLILPLYVLCTYAVAVPACVAEGIGAGGSLDRSAVLTRGVRLGVFGLFVVYGIIEFIVEKLAGLVFPEMANGVNMGLLFMRPFLAAFQEVMVATAYFQLRADKEGVSVDKLAQVFD